MSVLSIVITCWLVLNAAVFAALLLRRPRPQLRSKLFRWILQSEHRRRTRSRLHHGLLARGNAGKPH
jgi:hypothetical protein